MDKRIDKQLAFSLEIDKVKNVFRQTHLSGNNRSENDAEHSWHMAVMAYLFREYANEKVDIAKVMLMCLIHDVVELMRVIHMHMTVRPFRHKRFARMPLRKEFFLFCPRNKQPN